MTNTIFILSTVLIIFGLFLDLLTLWLGLRRMNGDGPSGIPLLPLVCYAAAIAAMSIELEITGQLWWIAGMLAVFHGLCQVGIVLLIWAVRRMCGRR